MAAKLLRNVISWLEELFQPPMIALTLILGVLFLIAITDAVAWFIVLDKTQ